VSPFHVERPDESIARAPVAAQFELEGRVIDGAVERKGATERPGAEYERAGARGAE
jgi:hypothetical protein